MPNRAKSTLETSYIEGYGARQRPRRSNQYTSSTWTEERTEELGRLWAIGLSASQIASRLGGVTRNAVIGKVNRLGFLVRNNRIRRKLRTRPVKRPRPKKVLRLPLHENPLWTPHKLDLRHGIEPLPAAHDDPSLSVVALDDLEPHHCRWPVGEPMRGFCGCKRIAGLPYCEAHAGRAFRVAATPVRVTAADLAAARAARDRDYLVAKDPAHA